MLKIANAQVSDSYLTPHQSPVRYRGIVATRRSLLQNTTLFVFDLSRSTGRDVQESEQCSICLDSIPVSRLKKEPLPAPPPSVTPSCASIFSKIWSNMQKIWHAVFGARCKTRDLDDPAFSGDELVYMFCHKKNREGAVCYDEPTHLTHLKCIRDSLNVGMIFCPLDRSRRFVQNTLGYPGQSLHVLFHHITLPENHLMVSQLLSIGLASYLHHTGYPVFSCVMDLIALNL